MKIKNIIMGATALLSLSFAETVMAQVGKPFIHDPSTIAESDGKYYTFGTGSGGLVSDDGWNWSAGGVRPGGGVAPDIIKIGDRYYVAYAKGAVGDHASNVYVMWSKTLDPKSPDFGFKDETLVASSSGLEDCDAIDPAFVLGPDGKLWLSYGTYFGNIRLIELDPKTGKRVQGNKALDIAIDCEATDLEYRDGWYYLLGTHGTCCDGTNSTYNIVVGRSKKVTGPYLDNVGREMLKGGGKLVLAAGNRKVGAGHFGRFIVENGVEKMSFHWEADFDLGGRSTLGILPIVWKNGWPAAGENLKDGTYEIESERRGYALELVVDFTRMAGGMRGFGRNTEEPVKPTANQELADVINTWPTGKIDVRIGDYMFRPHQKWTITAVPDAGGYLGGPYYKIVIAGTDRALAATPEAEVITVPAFTGAPEQLWRIDQLTDGTYRIMPKVVPNSGEKLVLVSTGDSTPSLGKFDMNSDNSKWNFRVH
jgi:arabinan endo-1,5-alpha-L-arabinosidase